MLRTQKNLAPGRKKWIGSAIKRPGKLSALAAELGQPKRPFMQRSLSEQKAVLDLCVKKYGYRSCLGSTLLLRNLPAIRKSAKMRTRATALKDYLVQRYGGPGSFKSNPPNGQWQAIPAILAHYEGLSVARLTAKQVMILARETQ